MDESDEAIYTPDYPAVIVLPPVGEAFALAAEVLGLHDEDRPPADDVATAAGLLDQPSGWC